MSSWQTATNLLCVRLDSLGDVIMTTPALRALKASPAAPRITLLTSRSGAEAAKLIPEVDEVIEYDAPWMKATGSRSYGRADAELVARLAGAQFDAAVIFTTYTQSPLPAAMVCYQAGIPRRLAYCRENPYLLLTDWIPEKEPEQVLRHEAQRHLDLVEAAGFKAADERLSLRVPEDADDRVRRRLRVWGLSCNEPYIVIHPGATAASRRYPAASFARAVEMIRLRWNLPIIVTGDETERACINEVAGNSELVIRATGFFDIGELAALIAHAALLIVNNTGPAHIAAGLGTPVVSLYALTNPQHTPWKVPSRVLYHDVPCKFCYKSVCPQGHQDCLAKVTPLQVADAAEELLGLRIQTSERFHHADQAASPLPSEHKTNPPNLCSPWELMPLITIRQPASCATAK